MDVILKTSTSSISAAADVGMVDPTGEESVRISVFTRKASLVTGQENTTTGP